jgi:predicted aconitase with swiveling domain
LVGTDVCVEWVDNGPGWIAVLVESAERVLVRGAEVCLVLG